MKYLFTLITVIVVSVSYAQSDSTFQKYPITRKVDISFEVGGIFGINKGHIEMQSAGILPDGGQKKYTSQSYHNNMAEIAVIVAKPINQKLRIGGGVSFDIGKKDVFDPAVKHTSLLLPVYMDIKYNFINRRVSPFISSQIGAAYYTGSYEGYGATAGLNLGVKGYVSNRVALSFLVGGRFQHIYGGQYFYTDEQGNNTVQVNGQSFMYFVTTRFGITF